MRLNDLVRRHRESAPGLQQRSREEMLLWYADLGLEIGGGESVNYHCTGCGTRLSMSLEEFLHLDSNADLRCSNCRGELEERGGPMD